VQKGLTGPQRTTERHKEGIVLVIGIGIQHRGLAERDKSSYNHQNQKTEKGQAKGKGGIIPVSIFKVNSFHSSPGKCYSKYFTILFPWGKGKISKNRKTGSSLEEPVWKKPFIESNK
jgi:hypothetical protein